MKCPVKVRVDITLDPVYSDLGLGKRYKVIKWVFERKTGRTVDYCYYGTNYTFKEACATKKMILDSYLG